ncbi:MAG TPA: APC family permease, partial [Natronosporangium sp.]
PAVVFFVMSAATPLTVVAGVITLAYAITGRLGLPLAFLLVGVLLSLFAVGYVAMSRYISNAGAFYAYISHGLGRPIGVGAAWVALLAYNLLQVGLYGVIGAAATPLLQDWFGLDLPWWVIALVAWAIVGFLGLQQVDVNGKVLAVLLCAEVVVIALFSITNLGHPSGTSSPFTTLEPGNLFGSGVGALLVLGVLGFVGFEAATVFSEESKNPRRTVPVAMYTSITIIAVLYALAAWGMAVAVGADQIAAQAGELEVALIFELADQHLGTVFANIGWALLLTSLLAAMIAFHNITARYGFALGRERVLPRVFGRTSQRSGSPKIASLVQSLIGVAVITTYALAGWDPLVQLFFWGGTSGGLGVLLLITCTSVAVVVYFARQHREQETVWARHIAPVLATVTLLVVVWLALSQVDTLLGVPPDHTLRWFVPVGYLVVFLAGTGWGLILRASRPDVYAGIGLGARAVTVGIGIPPAKHPQHSQPSPASPASPGSPASQSDLDRAPTISQERW